MRSAMCLAAALGLVVLLGCGRGPGLKTQRVEGVLTLDGKPVEGATVTFVPVKEGQGASAVGVTDASGKFTLTVAATGRARTSPGAGTLPGEYFVGVVKTTSEVPASEEEEEASGKAASTSPGTSPSAEPKLVHVVPPKYNNPRTSGLRVTVKEGPNTIPIELSSK